ncbi:MAG: glycosyltransferase family 2 protein [Candidatus Acidiferrum sp.]
MTLKLVSHINGDSDLIEAWLEYYLALGIEEFHVVLHGEPGGNDRLLGIKNSYPIIIEDTYGGPFLAEQKKSRLDAVLARHPGQWIVLVDSDEFVEFPYQNIPKTIQKLRFAHANVMMAPMLQRMMAAGALETPPVIQNPFETFPLCSEDLYERMGVSASILKFPLFFCTDRTELEEEGNHGVPRGFVRRTSAMCGVTHHFKFRRNISERLDRRIHGDHPWRHECVQFREYLDSHLNRLPLEGSFTYSRQELFKRGLLRKLSLRNNVRSIGQKIFAWDRK